MALTPQLSRHGCVGDVDPQFAPAIRLKDTLRGPARQRGDVQRRSVEAVAHAVDAAAYVRERERAKQTLGDAIALERGEAAVGRRDLGAIVEFLAANSEGLALNARKPLEADCALFQKEGGGVGRAIVGGEVRRPEPELSRRTCFYRICLADPTRAEARVRSASRRLFWTLTIQCEEALRGRRIREF